MDFAQTIRSGYIISSAEHVEQAIERCLHDSIDTGNGISPDYLIEIQFRFGVSLAQPIAELHPGIVLCAICAIDSVKFCTMFRASPHEAWQLNTHYLYSSTPAEFMARPVAEQLYLMNWR